MNILHQIYVRIDQHIMMMEVVKYTDVIHCGLIIDRDINGAI